MDDLIFEVYEDHFAAPSVWRWRGVDPETSRVLVVTWYSYEDRESATEGALSFVLMVGRGEWELTSDGTIRRKAGGVQHK